MPETINSPLLSLIEERGLIDDLQREEIVEEIGRSGKAVGQVLHDLDIIDSDTQLEIMAEYLGTEVIDLRNVEFTDEVLAAIPKTSVRMYQCIAIADFEDSVQVVMVDPLNPGGMDELGFMVKKDIQVMVADPTSILDIIDKYYGAEGESMDEILADLGESGLDFEAQAAELEGAEDIASSIADMADAAPIIRFVNLVLVQAVQDRASDIHFEPFEDEFKIRYRIDGSLYEMSPPPLYLAMPVISRLKVVANLNISERRLPQDGRISVRIAGKEIDLRVSSLPTKFGESMVLRVLDRENSNLELEDLGFPDYIKDYVIEAVEQPNGIFVVTGPTGCGKTTSLYACIKRVNKISDKILTAEDPVEYAMEGIMQVAINEGIGMTFMAALRAFLRQDPDVIMVGEMRDIETAQIAVQASLTGHLVLSTLHTNDAPGAVTRLVDMGVEPFLASSTMIGVLAQRLVRTICKKCRAPFEPTENQLAQLNLSPYDVGDKVFYFGRGCQTCNDTGYRGRKGIYELLDMSESIKLLVNERAPAVVLRQKAIELGMQTLRDDGLRGIFDGETTIEEVLKYT
ncbi:GspE/PulE family protein [Verrucomicrobia bacterium]|nr:GspE/PulE family protein [Verrucomicrobiota bacterium]